MAFTAAAFLLAACSSERDVDGETTDAICVGSGELLDAIDIAYNQLRVDEEALAELDNLAEEFDGSELGDHLDSLAVAERVAANEVLLRGRSQDDVAPVFLARVRARSALGLWCVEHASDTSRPTIANLFLRAT